MKSEYTGNVRQDIIRFAGHGWLATWMCANVLLLAGTLLCSGEDFTTTIIDGVTSNHTAGVYYVGATGIGNFLMITNGGQLESSQSSIGNDPTAHGNVAVVTGKGSAWSTTGDLHIGFYGSSNNLQILEGGRVNAYRTMISAYPGVRRNQILVSGSGSQFNGGGCWLGVSGSETELIIQEGGQATFGDLLMSAQGIASSNWCNGNRILVAGTNSFLSAGRIAFPEIGISNRFTILNGARVSSGWSYMASGRFCDVLISGPESSWTNTSLEIYSGTSNRFTVADGAVLDTQKINLAGSRNGELRVAGIGSILNLQSSSSMQLSGSSNRLTISDGASANLPGVIIGGTGSGNALHIEGPNTLLSLPSDLIIDSAGGSNSVTITGENTRFLLASNLVIGLTNGGGNVLEISSGAWLTNRATLIGSNSSDNLVSIIGPGSWWSMGSNFFLGGAGTNNQLHLLNGATLTNGPAYLGADGPVRLVQPSGGIASEVKISNTRAIISGSDTRWEIRGPLYLGSRSAGNTLDIAAGAEVTAKDLYIGNESPLVAGDAAALQLAPNLLRVSGGRLSVTKPEPGGGYLRLRYGTLLLEDGVVEADWIWAHDTAQDFDFRSGECRVKRLWTYIPKPFVIGDGQRAARLTVTGANHVFNHGVKISPGSTFILGGTLNGSIETEGTLRPEYAGYPSVVQGDLIVRDTGRMLFSLGGSVQGNEYGSLRISGSIQYGGRLQIYLAPGYQPAATNQFILLQYRSRTGDFLNATNGARLITTDGLGSFHVQLTETNLILTDFASTDLDGDGLADAWALQHFGHTPLSQATLNADADGDGASNLAEFQAGTDPHSAASVFRASLTFRNNSPVLRFTAVDTRQYRLWASDNLVPWTEIPTPLFESVEPGWLEWRGTPSPEHSIQARYYRVMAQ